MKKITALLLITLLCTSFFGCSKKEILMEDLLPQANVIKVSASFLNIGVGDNVPQLSYEAVNAECGEMCDCIYTAAPVTIEIPENYSPELNASHILYLTTSAGTLNAYYDDFQNLINVPSLKKVNNENVRIYLSFQPEGLEELLRSWESNLIIPEPDENEPQPEETPVETGFIAPDDSSLRGLVDAELLSAAGTLCDTEPATCVRESSAALYYAFGYHEKPELPQNKVLLVAESAQEAQTHAEILSVEANESYIRVTVDFSPLTTDAQPTSAVLCDRAQIDVGKPIVFVDKQGNVLYVEILAIPGEITEDLDPEAANAEVVVAAPETVAEPTTPAE